MSKPRETKPCLPGCYSSQFEPSDPSGERVEHHAPACPNFKAEAPPALKEETVCGECGEAWPCGVATGEVSADALVIRHHPSIPPANVSEPSQFKSEPPIDFREPEAHARSVIGWFEPPVLCPSPSTKELNRARAHLALAAERDALKAQLREVEVELVESRVRLTSENAELRAERDRHTEAEAANCPEDQSCIDTIKALRAKVSDLKRSLEVLKSDHGGSANSTPQSSPSDR